MSLTVSLLSNILVAPAAQGGTVSVDLESFPIVVDADPRAGALEATVAETGTSRLLSTYTEVGGKRRFAGSVPLPDGPGTYTLTLRARDIADSTATAISPSLTLQVIRASMDDIPQALPPAGIRVYRLANFVKVEWQTPRDTGFLGVRVVVSPDSSGVTTPYVQWGELVAASSRTALDTLSTTVTRSQNGAHALTLTDLEQVEVAYSTATFPRSQVEADEFYVALTTIIQDPDTHHVHESYAAGPFRCSFVDLRTVAPTDFPAGMTPEEIAVQIVKRMSPNYPGLDLSPRSEVRDTLVDPVALELANASTREWFSRISSSVDALIGVDDTDGDGVSDDPAANDYKQAIAKAFRLSDDQVQALVDSRFDALGANYGVPRGGSEAAMVDVLVYVLQKPTKRITISEGALVNTLPDDDTPSVTFQALGSAVIDPSAADSFYLPDMAAWGVTIPCLCTSAGDIGNVGSGTVCTPVSGFSQTVLCTNPSAADFGLDAESNHNYASRIKIKQVVGVDTGRTSGYEEEARKAYGVVSVRAVPSGRLEMLRDWDPLRQKHIFGTVDVYARGRSFSQNPQKVPYTHATTGTEGVYTTYSKVRMLDAASLRFGFEGIAPTNALCAISELYAERQGVDSLSLYLGVENARFDPVSKTFFLDPEALTYRESAGVRTLGVKNSAMVAALQSGSTLWARTREWSPLSLTPAKQPVSQVYSVAGADGLTGVIPPSQVRLIKTEDPLLEGGSSLAHDRVVVDNSTLLESLTLTFESGGEATLDLGEGVYVPLDSQGTPSGLTSVLSSDSSTLYGVNSDYVLVSLGQYGRYGIRRTSTSRIPLDTEFKVTLLRYRFRERLTQVTEVLTLTGSRFASLGHMGVLDNTWIPESHGKTDLLTDPLLSSFLRSNRFLRVVYSDGGTDIPMERGRDYLLEIDATTGAAKLARCYSGSSITSRIPDGGAVTVTYYTAEVFEVVTRYPQFVGQIAERLEATRHGAADVLVKVMQENFVDLDFSVALSANATPEVVDRKIRTVITAAHDNAKTLLAQSEIVRCIKALPGVKNVQVPFRRMAKADGSYDIGLVIPTGTKWDSMATLAASDSMFANRNWAARTFVTHSPVLRYQTIPSGGKADSYVGLLYEGEAYTRCLTLEQLRTAQTASFYIIGINDSFDQFTPISSAHWGKVLLVAPGATSQRAEVTDPGQLAFRLTYQVFGEGGAQDIPLSPTEYLRPGRITIDYVLDGETL